MRYVAVVDIKNKQTPLSPNNEINKPTVGGYSNRKSLKMKVADMNERQKKHFTISNMRQMTC